MLKQFIDRVSGQTSPDDVEIYRLIHEEIASEKIDAGLWTKAIAVTDGDPQKTQARYIEMRANALRDERKHFFAALLTEKNRKEREAAQQARVAQQLRQAQVQRQEAERRRQGQGQEIRKFIRGTLVALILCAFAVLIGLGLGLLLGWLGFF